MTNCTRKNLSFPALNRRKIETEFSGGDITSDGGVLLLRQMDKQHGLMESIDHILHDPREQDQVTHSQISLLRQRVYGLCLGYEDLNDHKTLRTDPAIQTALDRDNVLASQSTLCRLENRTDRRAMVDIHKVFFEQFIASFKKPPKELILDFDATDDPTHGSQEHVFYHGYYRHYCFYHCMFFVKARC